MISVEQMKEETGGILAVCASMKPAPGLEVPSACRELLRKALVTIHPIFPKFNWLDLREAQLPFFEGQMPSDVESLAVKYCVDAIRNSKGIVFSIPAYWGSVGGAFKNFIELLCGPYYGKRTAVNDLFKGKPVVCFIVGSDQGSATEAGKQMIIILKALGANNTCVPILLADPRKMSDVQNRLQELIASIGSLAKNYILNEVLLES